MVGQKICPKPPSFLVCYSFCHYTLCSFVIPKIEFLFNVDLLQMRKCNDKSCCVQYGMTCVSLIEVMTVNERRRAVRDCLKSSHNSHSMTFHPTLVVCWAVTADQYEPYWEIRNAALFPKCPLLRWTVDISRSMRISAVILPRIYKYW